MSARLWNILKLNFADTRIIDIEKSDFRKTRMAGAKSWEELCDLTGKATDNGKQRHRNKRLLRTFGNWDLICIFVLMAGGRPTKYTKELATEICLAVSNSSKGLVPLCKENSHWPSHSTIRKWIFEIKEFSDNYEKAKQEQADFLADEIIEIADDATGDLIAGQFGDVPNGANVQRSRLKIDSRKWVAAKLKPKKYGDKLDVDHAGSLTIKVRVEGEDE